MSIMHSMSDDEKTKYKAMKTKEIRDYHSNLINDLGISLYDFSMKTQFLDEHKRLVVGIFPSEFKKLKGFYFELIDSDLNPIDPNRTVYRVAPHYEFDNVYELNHKGSYLVPLDQLRIVNPQSVAISKYSAVDTDNVFKPTQKAQEIIATIPKASSIIEDDFYSSMTIRDYVAIQTGRPVSTKQWLNELVKNK